jgi:hypothetical protein|tara:strand:+ start:391 stop:2103 length:1713 start_codon:yes stop_codon:yes gene_type:complete
MAESMMLNFVISKSKTETLDLFSNAYGWDLRSQHYGEGKEIQFIQDKFKTFKAFNYGSAWLTDGKSKDGFKDTDPVYFIYIDSLITGADAFLLGDVWKERTDQLLNNPMGEAAFSEKADYLLSALLWLEDDKGRTYRPSGNVWNIGGYLACDENIFSFIQDRLHTGGGLDKFKDLAGRVKVAAADPVIWGNKQENLNLGNVRTFVIPKEIYDYGNQVYAARVDSRYLTHQTDLPDGRQLSIFETEIKGESYTVVYTGQAGDLPTFSHLTGAVLWSSWEAAHLQGTASPEIQMSDLANLLDEKKRSRIEKAFESIFNTSLEWNNNKGGKEYKRILTRPFSQVEFSGKGKGASVRPTINQAYVKSLQQIGQPGGQFIKIPRQLIAASKKFDNYSLNYFKYLVGLSGHRSAYKPLVKTVLIKYAGYPEKKLKKMSVTGDDSIYDLIRSLCKSAVSVGLLKDYQLDTRADRTAKNWKVWKVSQRLGSFKDLEGDLYDKQRSAGLDVITLIMDWISGFSNVKKSPGAIHKDLTRWIDKLGTKEVYKIFLNIQNRTEKTHPGHLFTLLKIKAKQSE